MGNVYFNTLVDLDGHGLLALTTDTSNSYSAPLPAQKYGYAGWLAPGAGELQDRLELCTRPRSEEQMLDRVDDLHRKMAIRQDAQAELKWLRTQVDESFREVPTAAHPMGNGLVFLMFVWELEDSQIADTELRVIDVPNNRLLYSTTPEALSEELGRRKPGDRAAEGSWATHPLVQDSGRGYVQITFDDEMLLRWDGDRLRYVSSAIVRQHRIAIGAEHVFCHHWNREPLAVLPLADPTNVREVPLRHGRKGWWEHRAALAADRCVIAHAGGTVEIIDGHGNEVLAVRPDPSMGRKDQMQASITPDGRHVLTRRWDGTSAIDVERGMVAEVLMLSDVRYLGQDDPPPNRLVYRECCLATNEGVWQQPWSIAIASRPESLMPQLIRWEELDWQPGLRPGSGKGKKKGPAAYKTLLPYWRKPSLALTPAKSGKLRTRLYGAPDLPEGFAWPEHEGRRMLLLCQVDLAEVGEKLGAPWPQQGGLLLFVAVDEDNDNELLIDDSFNPVATRLLHVPAFGPTAPGGPQFPAQKVRLRKDKTELPQADAAIVLRELLSDEDREQYRTYAEERQDEGPTGGHRLGGYPANVQGNQLEAAAEEIINEDAPEEDAEGWGRAARWRLLLQLDSDDHIMWGTDMGTLHVMIHDDDLAAGEFGRAAVIVEGH
ncbi:MAG TPA: YwqG family protein [Nevskiaceae bacterium]|nr:YwqG family protein [Nevskiaceae bacterium]